MKRADKIVDMMMSKDDFSQWLGIEVVEVQEGSCVLRMTVRKEMTNGFDVAHGGISYSLADSALAFSCNGHGMKTMSIETSISHLLPIHAQDVLTARSQEVSKGNRISVYSIDITNQKEEMVAQFKGTAYHSTKEWDA